jgi:predicted site-specific integrase-resolvase
MESPILVAIRQWCDDNDEVAYTTKQAADLCGVSTDTIVRWRKSGAVVPSESLLMGKTRVFLYTPRDILSLKQYANESYPGKRTDLEERLG